MGGLFFNSSSNILEAARVYVICFSVPFLTKNVKKSIVLRFRSLLRDLLEILTTPSDRK
jgi:hypothetical protein